MSDILRVKADIDMSSIMDKFTELCNDDTLRLAIHQTFARYCDPYVPFLHGFLSQTLDITPEYVRYVQPYAHYQYYGTWFNHTLDYHPLASAEWDQAMLENNRENFEEEIKQLVIRRYRELYGDS